MKFACIFGHKWVECECERCGKTRKANKVLLKSPMYKCDVCGKTGEQIEQANKEKEEKMNQINAGLYIDMNPYVMLFCKKCNSFICSKCAIDNRDDFKKCPSCKASFGFDSIAENTKTPFAILTLVKQKNK